MTHSRMVVLTDGLNGQVGGVQRVSRSVLAALSSDTTPSQVWSANDSSPSYELPLHMGLRCFDGRHAAMMLEALVSDPPSSCRRIYCMHLRLAPVAALMAWRFGCPLDVFLHGVEAWGGLNLLQRQSLQWATSFSANSRYTLQRFQLAHPEFANRESMVISLGLNEEFVVAPLVKHPVLSKVRRYFLSVTRYAETYKGEGTLLEAFQSVHATHPDVHLICAGDGPTRCSLEEKARSMGIGDFVHFVGRVSDGELAGLYAHTLGFVLLSEGEGFGIVFLEAMYHGKPCIASNVDAAQEIVLEGQTGLLVPPGDVSGTARAMMRLLQESSFVEKLGNAGRQLVVASHMPVHFQERLREHFRNE